MANHQANELGLLERLVFFHHFHYCCVDKQLTVSQHFSLNLLRFSFAFFLLDGIDLDAHMLAREVAVHPEDTLLAD